MRHEFKSFCTSNHRLLDCTQTINNRLTYYEIIMKNNNHFCLQKVENNDDTIEMSLEIIPTMHYLQ